MKAEDIKTMKVQRQRQNIKAEDIKTLKVLESQRDLPAFLMSHVTTQQPGLNVNRSPTVVQPTQERLIILTA
jgi:hypothetical protein